MKKLIFVSVCLALVVVTFTVCPKKASKNNLNSQTSPKQINAEKMNDSSTQTEGLTGTENGHCWVDLGLPEGTKWATCNVGATKPEEYGNLYAWGEVNTKDIYLWYTYKYGTYDYICDYKNAWRSDYDCVNCVKLTKYCNDNRMGKDGFADTLTTLEATDDVATANWGEAWRMPTHTEWNRLHNPDYCTWIWTNNYNRTGIAGCIVISRNNGNSIFLPAAGFRYGDSILYENKLGYYWASSLHHRSYTAYMEYFKTNDIRPFLPRHGDDDRFYGYSVRPVCK